MKAERVLAVVPVFANVLRVESHQPIGNRWVLLGFPTRQFWAITAHQMCTINSRRWEGWQIETALLLAVRGSEDGKMRMKRLRPSHSWENG
jgi:hypothetical protein